MEVTELELVGLEAGRVLGGAVSGQVVSGPGDEHGAGERYSICMQSAVPAPAIPDLLRLGGLPRQLPTTAPSNAEAPGPTCVEPPMGRWEQFRALGGGVPVAPRPVVLMPRRVRLCCFGDGDRPTCRLVLGAQLPVGRGPACSCHGKSGTVTSVWHFTVGRT